MHALLGLIFVGLGEEREVKLGYFIISAIYNDMHV